MRLLPALAALLLAGCAATTSLLSAGEGTDILLVGEQHDADSHAALQRQLVADLARRGALGALVLEMAERGTSTANLPASANEDAVRAALRWDARAWPWERYGPAVMGAVAAGVPVVGANLPRDALRAAMADASLDGLLPTTAFEAQREAIRTGHCDLLPASQIGPMTRVQVARDREMARVVQAAVVPGRTVVLLAGAGHVQPELGVPLHLQPPVRARTMLLPAVATGKDYCAELRRRMAPPAR